MGFMTLKKGQPLTEEEIALLSTRKGRSYGDGGTGGPGESGGGDGGTNSSHGSTASNSNKNSSSSAMEAASRYDEDGDGLDTSGFSASALGYSSPFSAEANPNFGYSKEADFSGGLSGSYGGINVGNVSNGNYGSNGYSLNTKTDFSSGFDSYDKYGSLDGLDSAYNSGFMDSPSWMDKVKSYVLENPLAIAGGLLGGLTLGPMGALSLGRIGSAVDDFSNPTMNSFDKALGVISSTGAVPGVMGTVAKAFSAIGDKLGDPTAQGGSMVGDGATTAGNRTAAESKLNYTAPKVEYKFDPFGASNGLMGSNGKLSYSQLHKLVDEFKKKAGGLMGNFNNRSLGGA